MICERAQLTGRMRVVCAWCRGELAPKACEPAQDGLTTHGICQVCKDAQLAASGIRLEPGPGCAVMEGAQ